MISPYKEVLSSHEGQDVVIDRDGASRVAGRLDEVTDFGCRIATKGSSDDSSTFLFIAYEDIRGVGIESYDSIKIGK